MKSKRILDICILYRLHVYEKIVYQNRIYQTHCAFHAPLFKNAISALSRLFSSRARTRKRTHTRTNGYTLYFFFCFTWYTDICIVYPYHNYLFSATVQQKQHFRFLKTFRMSMFYFRSIVDFIHFMYSLRRTLFLALPEGECLRLLRDGRDPTLCPQSDWFSFYYLQIFEINKKQTIRHSKKLKKSLYNTIEIMKD